MTTDSVEQICQRLERVEIKAVEWRERNHVAFDNFRHEILPFTR